MPFVSLVIPVYNAAQTLPKCLDSLVHQRFHDWECICVDDGSFDDSLAILNRYAREDARFKVLSQPNSGPSAARNRGLDVATGEWIAFIDADDWVDEHYLSSFAARGRKADVNFTGIRFVLTSLSSREFHLPFVFADSHEAIAELCERLAYNETRRNLFGYSFNKFLRRELIESDRLRFIPGLSASEDELFMLEAARRAASVAVSEDVAYNYRLSETGLTGKTGKPRQDLAARYLRCAAAWAHAAILRFCRTRAYEELYWSCIETRSHASLAALIAFCRHDHRPLSSPVFKWNKISMLARIPLIGYFLLSLFFRVAWHRHLKRMKRGVSIWNLD